MVKGILKGISRIMTMCPVFLDHQKYYFKEAFQNKMIILVFSFTRLERCIKCHLPKHWTKNHVLYKKSLKPRAHFFYTWNQVFFFLNLLFPFFSMLLEQKKLILNTLLVEQTLFISFWTEELEE